ncbi:conserved hypothetical protein [Verticillium alfalfae VaMs.102]|uniref:Transport protein particle subunit trs85-2 n=1 Tax=Verticillium alfalfae (strain VaMs.102 / ATCC MYA-4576 / FGSC 10136) TaxID=526221 RepID=C9STQ0_VERA1|nr:conserved hypothetical protein [Verticillium alfalfae VaMs.102]EEY22211.1 conserved hypothetical protein [Verticillium alfalfae VaMs.102]
MQSPDLQSPDRDVSPSESIQTLPTAASALRLPKRQNAFEGHPLAQNETGLPYRRSNPSAASLFASTQTPPGSRSESPVGRGGSPARNLSGPIFSGSGARSLIDSAADSPGDPLNLLLQSYVPHIAIYTSQETTNFANDKGFKNGLWELLRPFGERVQGKITIRDSNGSSRAWEDYSIRFVPFGDNIEAPDASAPTTANGLSESAAREKKKLDDVEAVVERHLRNYMYSLLSMPHHGHLTSLGVDIEATSPYYSLYLRRLLSGIPISPHETFSHPIACVIAISSRSNIPLPRSDWMTAEEELADIKRSDEQEDFEDPTRHIFESDATAIRTFVREMVTQSIIPTMERHVSVWNDQVASRRRGIAGRFMNLSRKWGGFGGSSRTSVGGSGSTSSFESQGYYRPDAPEAIMRKLADYAFMLRDWKLAHSTYDLLRSDFSDAKAWKYHAATNEMAALSLLIMPQSMSTKSRAETLDQMLEARLLLLLDAMERALWRSPIPSPLALELLRLRGGSSIDEAAKWGAKLLDSGISGPIGDGLLKERLAICYASKTGLGSVGWGNRTRKAAIWAVLAAEAWLLQGKYIQAQRSLNEAQRLYSEVPNQNGVSKFTLAQEFVLGLQRQLDTRLEPAEPAGPDGQAPEDEVEVLVDEESEPLQQQGTMRAKRGSVMARQGVNVLASLETAPLHEVVALGEKREGDTSTQGGFEGG